MPAKKKSSKTTTKKKATTKAKTPKKATKKTVKKARPEDAFYICNGDSCMDLLELSEKIHDMSEEMFSHHVNELKNDFANWIEDIFDEKELAKKLRNERNKDKQVIHILRYIIKRT